MICSGDNCAPTRSKAAYDKAHPPDDDMPSIVPNIVSIFLVDREFVHPNESLVESDFNQM
ncbi:hypothetical protein AGR7C_Cc40037 [Agrobacterium deltaense Zutra 3/1]|uniref:Uncharacterized protein n=2 Tax=Agrobacterium TaxID=357 RepID=A0A1S7QI88_9HYPH|nr:hypothetical protein AGR13a_Cc320028 [Agrobacterium genomosp. 13 str. CFBP 6927]CUX37080.1 hypothetical protein AGR7C_Cc40037 [Agrobacterium deltaense Zutra 3/1]